VTYFTVLIHFYCQVLLIKRFNFSSQYVLLALTSGNTNNIAYYTAILNPKLVFLVLMRLIAIKIFNLIAALLNFKHFLGRLHELRRTMQALQHCI